MTDGIVIFDRAARRAHRARGAALAPDLRFLGHEVRARLVERLSDVRRRFSCALDLNAGDGGLAAALGPDASVVALDAAPEFARLSRPAAVGEEELLPFAEASFDLVLSTLGLHWANDLPGALVQIRRVLKPDGLLLAALLGGRTLWELRECLIEAELELVAGASPRVSPMADLRDLAGLMQRAGFALPVADSETLTLTYPHAFALMRELRALGETNALLDRPRHFTRRAVLMRAAELYRERFGDGDDRIPATFQVITLTGWAPAEGQPKPLRPGTAQARLADALGTEERPAGERVRPPQAGS